MGDIDTVLVDNDGDDLTATLTMPDTSTETISATVVGTFDDGILFFGTDNGGQSCITDVSIPTTLAYLGQGKVPCRVDCANTAAHGMTELPSSGIGAETPDDLEEDADRDLVAISLLDANSYPSEVFITSVTFETADDGGTQGGSGGSSSGQGGSPSGTTCQTNAADDPEPRAFPSGGALLRGGRRLHPSSAGLTGRAGCLASRTAALGQLDHELAAWRDLFAPRGRLSVEQTRALVAGRDAQAEALAALIGAMGPAELDALRARFAGAKTRDSLVLIEGIGRSSEAVSVSVLEELYVDEAGYTLRSNILKALGDSPAPDHTVLLVQELWTNPDGRLSQTAAMMLRGEEAAAGDLAAAIDSELPLKTRLEAVASLGAVGSAQAEQAPTQVAADEDARARVRAYAEKELVRSFG